MLQKKLHKTFHGLTAGQILKTARLVEMRAGNVEIEVTILGDPWLAFMGSRKDGFGGLVDDVLIIEPIAQNAIEYVRLETTARSLKTLELLMDQADHMMNPCFSN